MVPTLTMLPRDSDVQGEDLSSDVMEEESASKLTWLRRNMRRPRGLWRGAAGAAGRSIVTILALLSRL